MNRAIFKQKGFTIVELAVVIMVIGILAAITIVSYDSAQSHARDVARTDSLVKIKDALELYYAKNGRYPAATSSTGGWEVSTDTPGTFMEQLYGYGVSETTVDPLNDSTYAFYYYRYSESSAVTNYGCTPGKGAMYVLRATYEKPANRAPINDIPKTECDPGQYSWRAAKDTTYVTHRYESD